MLRDRGAGLEDVVRGLRRAVLFRAAARARDEFLEAPRDDVPRQFALRESGERVNVACSTGTPPISLLST